MLSVSFMSHSNAISSAIFYELDGSLITPIRKQKTSLFCIHYFGLRVKSENPIYPVTAVCGKQHQNLAVF